MQSDCTTSTELESFCIHISFVCNANCKHCSTNSSINSKIVLNELEIESIIKTINDMKIGKLVFSGGEPLLHKHIILQIINSINKEKIPKNILLITNGIFASSEDKCKETLCDIPAITEIAMSFDEFHYEFVQEKNLINIKNYCEQNGINFVVNIVMGTPMGYKFVNFCIDKKINYELSALIFTGRGKSLKTTLPNRKTKIVESAKCQFLSHASFVPGKGYTWCPNYLPWNNEVLSNHIYAKDIKKMHKLSFFKKLNIYSYREILDLIGKSSDKYNTHCDICEEFFINDCKQNTI